MGLRVRKIFKNKEGHCINKGVISLMRHESVPNDSLKLCKRKTHRPKMRNRQIHTYSWRSPTFSIIDRIKYVEIS